MYHDGRVKVVVQKQRLKVMHDYRLQDMLFKVTVEPADASKGMPILFDIVDAIEAAMEFILEDLQQYTATHPDNDEEHQVELR